MQKHFFHFQLKRQLKHDFNNSSFDDENFLKQAIKDMAEKDPKLLQEYEDGITVTAKYCTSAENRNKPDSKPDDVRGAGL